MKFAYRTITGFLALAAVMFIAAPGARAGNSVRIESMSCSGVPDKTMARALESVWTDTGASCISCMACGCSCTAKGVYVTDGMSIDATRVSCEGKTYTLVSGGNSYKCSSLAMKPAEGKKKFGGGSAHKCDTSSQDWSPECLEYPGSQLISEHNADVNFEGDEFTVDEYMWQVFVTYDDFSDVNKFYRERLGREVRAVMANGKPMAVFPLSGGMSSVTVTRDDRARKVYITIFKYESTLE